MIDLNRALDLDAPEAAAFLDAIQGNIVKGHGRDFTAHVLVRMRDDVPAVRRWLAGLASERVTTAAAARRATRAWHGTDGPGEPFAMVLLSAAGYRHLGFPDDQLPVPAGQFVGPRDGEYFRFGMKEQAGRPRTFNDPRRRNGRSPTAGGSTRWCCSPTTTSTGCPVPSTRWSRKRRTWSTCSRPSAVGCCARSSRAALS